MRRLTEAILQHAASLPEGSVISAKGLLHLGARPAVDQALSRLVRRGQLLRAGWGLYTRPVRTRFGIRPPMVEKLIEALASARGEVIAAHWRDGGQRIRPDRAGPGSIRFPDVAEG